MIVEEKDIRTYNMDREGKKKKINEWKNTWNSIFFLNKYKSVI